MYDLVTVLAPQNRGWILDRVCQEIVAVRPDASSVHLWDGTLPPARAYYFSHFALFRESVQRGAHGDARTSVFFTHPPTRLRERIGLALELRRADAVISMSTLHARELVRFGVGRSRVHVAIPGADPERFAGHERGGGAIGLCSAFYERKSPETILALVRALPDRPVLLVGRDWERWERWDELAACPNLTYRDVDYDDYPSLYAQMDVFVSPSRLEGGPIPLLEAMMSNVVPVATDTGFAGDLIDDGVNGHLVRVGADIATFTDAIASAAENRSDVRSTVEDRTWRAWAERTYALATASS